MKDKTPEEAWSDTKPSVSYFRVFGCVCHVHVPDCKRKKLDGKSVKCVFLGVSEESKAYRLYEPVSQKIIISRDIVFEEDIFWEWNADHEKAPIVDSSGDGTQKEVNIETPPIAPAADGGNALNEPNLLSPGNNDSPGPNEAAHEPRCQRNRRPPIWMQDYDSGGSLSDDENLVNLMVSAADPLSFEEAVKDSKWRRAMDIEIQAIEKE